jgi:general stress protein 26
MKNVLKFKYEGKEGFLSVVENTNHFYALVEKDTPKVEELIQTNKLLISFELKQPKFQEVNVKVIFDSALTEWVYKKLEEEKNLYFKHLDSNLCVLEIEKDLT